MINIGLRRSKCFCNGWERGANGSNFSFPLIAYRTKNDSGHNDDIGSLYFLIIIIIIIVVVAVVVIIIAIIIIIISN